MVRSALRKAAWVGRTASMVLGLALVLALVVGLADAALGANGQAWVLGRINQATATTQLNGNVAGKAALLVTNSNKAPASRALHLNVAEGKAPMAVNSDTRVRNLNADKLDGMDSSAFASKTSEAWHEVGAAGQPAFNNPGGPLWQNSNDPRQFNTVGFYKDSLGTVHLKGVAQVASGRLIPAGSSCGPPVFGASAHVFVLPQGYRPARWAVFPTIRSELSASRVDILSSGEVYICAGADLAQGQWASLDGIEFRAAN